jgi:aryl-alcohol dehydrogenase
MHLISGRVIRGVVEGDADPPSFIPFLVEQFREGNFPIDRLADFYPFARINDAVAAGLSGRTIKPIVEF